MSSKGKLITLVITLLLLGSIFVVFQTRGASTIKGLDLQNGLVGYWNFEEGSGTQAGDMSGSGYDATLQYMNPATDWVQGKVGYGLNFDGVNDAVELPNGGNNLLCAETPKTVSAWILPTSTTVGTIVANHSGAAGGLQYRIQASTGWVNGEVNIGGTFYSASTSVSFTEMSHVVMTYDNETITVYVNGDVIVQNTDPAGSMDSQAASRALCIGLENNNDDCRFTTYNPFEGTIDEVRIYNRALSGEEIHALYEQTAQKLQTTSSSGSLSDGLVGHWTFDGGDMDLGSSTSEVKDVSGQDHHGDWQNHATTTVPGVLGQAVEFDGSNDYVDVDSVINGIDMDKGTMSAWVKRSFADDTSSNRILFRSQIDADNFLIARYIESSDKWNFRRNGSSKAASIDLSPEEIPQDEWTHVAWTWSVNASEAHVHLNGSLAGSTITELGYALNTTSAFRSH